MNNAINLDAIVLKELKKASKSRVIPFPLVYYRLGAIFHFDKEISKQILKILEKKGLIEIHEFHGVEILKGRFLESFI